MAFVDGNYEVIMTYILHEMTYVLFAMLKYHSNIEQLKWNLFKCVLIFLNDS